MQAIVPWVLSCQHSNGGFGGSSRNDPHMLYTLSAVQILALCNQLDLVDADKVANCKVANYVDAVSGRNAANCKR
eukprot:1149880-Pelagomonas_calceolata.AAC.3